MKRSAPKKPKTLFDCGFKKTLPTTENESEQQSTSTACEDSEVVRQSTSHEDSEVVRQSTSHEDSEVVRQSTSREDSECVTVSDTGNILKSYVSDQEAETTLKGLFPESKVIHQHQVCQLKCCTSVAKDQIPKKDKFVHSWLDSKELAFCAKTKTWWLVYVEKEGMFCWLCRKHDTCNLQNKSKVFNQTGSVRYKRSTMTDHVGTGQHKAAITSEITSRTSIFKKTVDEQKKSFDQNVKAAFFALYWLMKEELPNVKFSSLLLLVQKMGHPTIKHFKYTGAGTEQDMLLTIGQHVGNEVAENVQKSGTYGLLVDEATDITVKQQMLCFVQYCDREGIPCVDFLDVADVLEFGVSADAETLLTSIKHILQKNGLDIKDCSSFVSDGASVMVGKKNGVAAKLKSLIPSLISIHCICHRLALACTDSNKDIDFIATIERNLRQLWKFFDDSPKRTKALVKVQLATEEFVHQLPKKKRVSLAKKMKKACSTRWLSFDNAVKAFLENLPAVLQTLRLLQEDPIADGLLKRLSTFKFISGVVAMGHILPILASLSRSFQKGNINFSAVQSALDYTNDRLDELIPTEENDPVSSDLNSKMEGIYTELELSPSDYDWKLFHNLLKKYILALKKNIVLRFNASVPILECFSVFDPVMIPNRGTEEFKTYGIVKVQKLGEHFDMTIDPIVDQWNHFKYELNNWKKDVPVPTGAMMTDITTLEWSLRRMISNPSLVTAYPDLIKIAKIVNSLPVSNAWPERGASAMKRIKTRLRNSIKNDMLSSLLHVSINGPELDEADNVVEAATEKWLGQKQRNKLTKSNISSASSTALPASSNVSVTDTGVQTDVMEIQYDEDQVNRIADLMRKASSILGIGDESSDSESDDDDDLLCS